MASDAFKAQMEKFSAEYRAALPARIADMDALWARVEASLAAGAGALDGAALADLHRLLHTLAGSAKTFGLAPVSASAREAEHVLDPFITAGGAPDAATRARMVTLLESLRHFASAP